MIYNKISFLPLSSIVVSPARQRTEDRDESGQLTPASVYELALSIGRNQWVSTLLVEKDTNRLIAGERRYTAMLVLERATRGDFTGLKDPDKIATLSSICTCRTESFKEWTHAPVQLGTDLTPVDLSTFEWAENFHRLDLTWHDKARAAWNIHATHLKAAQESGAKWNLSDTAETLSTDLKTATLLIKAWREVERGDEKTKAAVLGSTTPRAAKSAVERIKERRGDPSIGTKPMKLNAEGELIARVRKPEVTLDSLSIPPSPSSSLLMHGDFHEFARNYSGPPFNFIHCDFPFGISFNKGGGMQTAADTKGIGDYDDTPEVYWNLLDTLHSFREELIAESAHIMFWFSQNWRRPTEDFFTDNFPDCRVQPFLLIWHTSDNSGIVPDPNRYGRRTYETALSISFGDRKIAKPVALSVASPRSSADKFHRSQKPLPVLSHFFEMYIDETSIVLDPTAGSSTSLVAAKKLGAKHVIGLELDEEMYDAASKYIDGQLGSKK